MINCIEELIVDGSRPVTRSSSSAPQLTFQAIELKRYILSS